MRLRPMVVTVIKRGLIPLTYHLILWKTPQPHRQCMDIAKLIQRSDNREALDIERPYATSDMYVIEISNELWNWFSHRNLAIPHERVRITRSNDVTRAVGAYASEVLLPICTTYMRPMGVLWKESVVDVFTNQPIAVTDCELSCCKAQPR